MKSQQTITKDVQKLAVDELVLSQWNPRSPEELDPSNPDMQSLAQSIASVGVLQPICVWRKWGLMDNEKGAKLDIVVAGHRRVTAAKLAGLNSITATVFDGITELQAREITRIENEVRLGIDPIEDAKLIGSMLKIGYTQKEIAARCGIPEARVCRRAKLLNLHPDIVKLYEEEKNITTDALERISLYPAEVQNGCIAVIKRCLKNSGERGVQWADVQWGFADTMRDLDRTAFDASACKDCPNRTGAQPDLWGDVKSGGLGKCLDKDCFARRLKGFIAESVQKKNPKAAGYVDGEKTDFQYWEAKNMDGCFSEKRTKELTFVWYWFSDYSREIQTLWGMSQDALRLKREEEQAQAEAQRAERAERDEAERLKRNLLESMRDDMNSAWNEIYNKICEAINEDMVHEKDLRVFAIDRAQCAALAAIVWEYFCAYDNEKEIVIPFLTAFPKIRDLFGVSQSMLDVLREKEENYNKALKEANGENEAEEQE